MVAPYIKDKFDIGVLRADGSTKVGMMLAKDKSGIPRYQTYTDEYLASQYFSDVPGYGNLPAEKELAILQDDWRSGFGQEIYETSDPSRYYSSTGMDMRFKGMGIAGQTLTTVKCPNDILPTGNTDGATAWTDEAKAYDNKIATPAYTTAAVATSTWSEFLQFDHAAMNTIAIKFYVDIAATSPEVDVDVYYDGGWVHVFSDVFDRLTWTEKNIIAGEKSVTACRIRIKNTDAGDTHTASIYEVAFVQSTAAGGNAIDMVEFNDNIYAAAGLRLLKMNTAGTIYSTVKIFNADITDLEVFSDSKLYILLGLSNAYWEITTGESFTVNTLTVHDFKYFAFVHTTVDTMYGSSAVNVIRSTANPANGGTQWSDPTTVGSSYYEITKLLEKNGALYIMKEDMPYYLNSSGVVKNDLAPELNTERKTIDNGRTSIVWQSNIYMPWGDQALLENDSGTNTFLNPADYCTNLADYNGQIMALAGDSRYLHAVVAPTKRNLLTNGSFENSDPPSGWNLVGVGATFARSSTQAKYGTYSGLLTRVGNDCWIEQFVGNPTRYQGKAVIFGAWVYATTANKCRILITDDAGSTYSSYNTGATGFEWLSTTVTIDAAATFIRVQLVIETTNISVYWDGAVLAEGSTLTITTETYPLNVLAGRYETIDNSTDWVWHPIAEIILAGCQTAFISSICQKRLWLGSTSPADALSYLPLPIGYGNITADANRSFKTGVTMTTPWLHGNCKSTTKGFPELELVMGHTYSANVYFTVEYEKLGDSSWTTIGNYTGTATSMTQSKYIPADGSSNKPKSTLFRLRFTAVTNSTSTTPILYSYHLKGLLFPTQREILACSVVCSNETVLRDGTIDGGSFATTEAVIAEMIASTWPVTFYDIQGNTLTVKPLPVNPLSTVTKYEKGREIERIYNFLLQKITLS